MTTILLPIQNADGQFQLLECLPEDLAWPDLQAIWRQYSVVHPICCAPPEQKLDVFFQYACKSYGAPVSLGTVFNPGWTAMLMDQVRHDCMVVSADLVPYLTTRGLFAEQIKHLTAMAIVGEKTPEQFAALQAQHPALSLHSLPSPFLELAYEHS